MRPYPIIILMAFFISCSSTNKISGVYGTTAFKLQLKPDSTFFYQEFAFHNFKHSSGTWKQIGNKKIELNSKIQFTTVPLKVKELAKSGNDNLISVNVNIKNGGPLSNYVCEITINNSIYRSLRCDSLSTIKVSSVINKIRFSISKKLQNSDIVTDAIFTDTYIPQLQNGANFEFSFDVDEAYYFYEPFIKTTYSLENRALLIYNSDRKTWLKIPKLALKDFKADNFNPGDIH